MRGPSTGNDSVPHIACILLNWNGWQDTIECLHALRKCAYSNLNILVVDNGSTNDSVIRIRAAHPDIPLLESGSNLGFAGGSNIGIRHAIAHGADYVWLLNNDTVPVPNALSALATKALTDPRIGAVGSVCYYADKPDTVQIWGGGRVNLWIGYAPYSIEPRSDGWFHWLNGASLLVSVKAFEDVGLLDERFFLYWEDSELCLRLRKHGWHLAVAADSRILHKVNASTDGNKLSLDRYFTTSGLRILRLHSPAPHLAMFMFLMVRITRRIARLQFSRCRSVWTGVREYYHTVKVASKAR